MADPSLNVIGLISGTSADGIDAALCRISEGGRVRVRAFRTTPYPRAFKDRVIASCAPGGADAGEISQLSVEIGERFAAAAAAVADDANLALGRVDVIGSHGQTLHHGPGASFQIGSPATIAENTGCTTIADFRGADVAAGGEGAPLVPLAHWLLFGDADVPRAVQNLGGIGNVTVIPPDADAEQLVAFDTGPANMVIDGLMRLTSGGKKHFDRGGKLAARGTVDSELLEEFLAHPFFDRRPPKSTGRRDFGDAFVRRFWGRARARRLSEASALATAVDLTVESVAAACEPYEIEEMIVCGGGVHNPTMMDRLGERLADQDIEVLSSEELGIDPDAVEAVAFAILAYETALGRPGNVPAATGARGGRVLGVIAPGRNWSRLHRRLS